MTVFATFMFIVSHLAFTSVCISGAGDWLDDRAYRQECREIVKAHEGTLPKVFAK